jgi:hypothetical protein
VAGHADSVAPDEPTWCPDCYRSLWQGGRCKRRDCAGHAPIYLRDQTERLRENLAAWDRKTCLVTLTAPGVDTLPWDRSKCPAGEHKCSGRLGCRVQWLAAAEWKSTVTERLSELLKVAREQTRRKHGKHARYRGPRLRVRSPAGGVFHPHVVDHWCDDGVSAVLPARVHDGEDRAHARRAPGDVSTGPFASTRSLMALSPASCPSLRRSLLRRSGRPCRCRRSASSKGWPWRPGPVPPLSPKPGAAMPPARRPLPLI